MVGLCAGCGCDARTGESSDVEFGDDVDVDRHGLAWVMGKHGPSHIAVTDLPTEMSLGSCRLDSF